MSKTDAAYMRAYRARKKAEQAAGAVVEREFALAEIESYDLTAVPGRIKLSLDFSKANIRIAELEEEVRHLKEELAKRPVGPIEHTHFGGLPMADAPRWGFNSRPFTPVPKRATRG